MGTAAAIRSGGCRGRRRRCVIIVEILLSYGIQYGTEYARAHTQRQDTRRIHNDGCTPTFLALPAMMKRKRLTRPPWSTDGFRDGGQRCPERSCAASDVSPCACMAIALTALLGDENHGNVKSCTEVQLGSVGSVALSDVTINGGG